MIVVYTRMIWMKQMRMSVYITYTRGERSDTALLSNKITWRCSKSGKINIVTDKKKRKNEMQKVRNRRRTKKKNNNKDKHFGVWIILCVLLHAHITCICSHSIRQRKSTANRTNLASLPPLRLVLDSFLECICRMWLLLRIINNIVQVTCTVQ